MTRRPIPEAELVIANAVAELRIAIGRLWVGMVNRNDHESTAGIDMVTKVADGLEAALHQEAGE